MCPDCHPWSYPHRPRAGEANFLLGERSPLTTSTQLTRVIVSAFAPSCRFAAQKRLTASREKHSALPSRLHFPLLFMWLKNRKAPDHRGFSALCSLTAGGMACSKDEYLGVKNMPGSLTAGGMACSKDTQTPLMWVIASLTAGGMACSKDRCRAGAPPSASLTAGGMACSKDLSQRTRSKQQSLTAGGMACSKDQSGVCYVIDPSLTAGGMACSKDLLMI